MQDAKPAKTPVDINSEGSEFANQNLHQSAVGSLLYLATRTCPDIAFAVGNVARYCCKPTKLHWTAVFRYLRGTMSLGLLYHEGELDVLYGYSEQIGEVIVMTTNLPQVSWRHCSNMEE
jgi:hypothetical protein